MKNQDKTPVDFNKEVAAITEYLSTRWTPLPNMAELVLAAAVQGWYNARGWLDRFTLDAPCRARLQERQALFDLHLSEDSAALARWYDVGCRYLDELPGMVELLRETAMDMDGRWDFEKRSKALFRNLAERFPGLAQLRPHGWDELYANYTDFAGMEEYCNSQQQADEAAFGGTLITGALSPSFPTRVALPYVMYDQVCQGRSAALTLVSAIYAQFLGLREQENTRQVLAGVQALDLGDNSPEVVFELTPVSEHPLTGLLLQMAGIFAAANPGAQAKEAFEESLRSALATKSLSDEEREARRTQARSRALQELLEEISARNGNEGPEHPWNQKQARATELAIAGLKAMTV